MHVSLQVDHVVLHENSTERNLHKVRLSHIGLETHRIERLNALQQQSFLERQSAKQAYLWRNGVDHVGLLPEGMVNMYLPGAKKASMESSHRTYALSLKAKAVRFDKTPSRELTPDLSTLRRSKTFNILHKQKQMMKELQSTSQVRRHSKTAGARPDTSATNTTSLMPRKPASMLRMSNHPQQQPQQQQAGNRVDRSNSDLPLNLTRSFTTYNTKWSTGLRREKTVADPQNVRKEATNDPRFKKLRRSLVAPSNKLFDTTLQLSPSGRHVMQRFGNPPCRYESMENLLRRLNTEFPQRERPERIVREPTPLLRRKVARFRERFERKRTINDVILATREAFVDDDSDFRSTGSSASVALFSLRS